MHLWLLSSPNRLTFVSYSDEAVKRGVGELTTAAEATPPGCGVHTAALYRPPSLTDERNVHAEHCCNQSEGATAVLGGKSVPVPLRPPQIRNELPWQ